jgi:hypothetical protein
LGTPKSGYLPRRFPESLHFAIKGENLREFGIFSIHPGVGTIPHFPHLFEKIRNLPEKESI